MKFLHLSDLHLGKSVHEFSMLEDQEHILKVILGIAENEKPQAVFISGDVFDRSVAPTEALRIFEDFLVGLTAKGMEVFIISGNHDSADRLAFGSRLMERSGVHIARVYNGHIEPITLNDEYGEVLIYMLPFLKPIHVKRFFPEIAMETWTDAMKTVIDSLSVDATKRNILLAHQFVTGAARCESEELNVGGADNVDAAVFSPFDYVALGHLHGGQNIGENARYCGTPLKYSFSEAKHKKSVSVVTLNGDGAFAVNAIPLVPKRDMREIRGAYLEVSARSYYENQNTDDYLRVTLTDEDDQPDALAKLRVIYPNLMKLDYDNKRTRTQSSVAGVEDASQFTPIQLFEMFFEEQNGQPVSETQKDYLSGLIEQLWEGEK